MPVAVLKSNPKPGLKLNEPLLSFPSYWAVELARQVWEVVAGLDRENTELPPSTRVAGNKAHPELSPAMIKSRCPPTMFPLTLLVLSPLPKFSTGLETVKSSTTMLAYTAVHKRASARTTENLAISTE